MTGRLHQRKKEALKTQTTHLLFEDFPIYAFFSLKIKLRQWRHGSGTTHYQLQFFQLFRIL